MSFSDIKDQEMPLRLLRNILKQNRVPNGLLFWGPEGVGKRTTALELAKAINCKAGDFDACDACLSCRKVTSGNHPDVKIVAPAGKTRIINVEAIDAITELSAYRPFEGKWRAVLIEDADRMNESAQNHFLKTLEEPPSNTLFVLQSYYPNRLLPTIRSRCQQVRFGALQPATVSAILRREHPLDVATADALAAVAQGQVSRALDLVTSNKRNMVLDIAARLNRGDDPLLVSEQFVSQLREATEALKAALLSELEEDASQQDMSGEDLADQKKEQEAFIEGQVRRDYLEYLYLFETWYRDVWVYSTTGDDRLVLNRDQAPALKQQRGRDYPDKLAAIERAWVYIERNLAFDRIFRDLFFVLAA
ncbi:MAG: DNA polymerase III subunit delta' [Candidatus Hydrogenedentes bacterium]|nr:DNA polymerase III subunit delta' [Candidatus Hydrogenedentota bacterium]